MDNSNNTSPNPKILAMIHGGMNVAYCADADRLRTIAGMLLPAVLIIIGGILVERSKRYREASDKATAAVALAMISGMLLKSMDAPDALVANETLCSAWNIIGLISLILGSVAWLGLMLLTIRYDRNPRDDVGEDDDE